ncbi:MAG: hypothetical protein KGI50_02430 [Patescibacteria group bacterium]|nr:hypothetical protein [Patescibacteria group bacterium]MDE2437797.1 hypothetical protein [Patescibacteria group bacterium]
MVPSYAIYVLESQWTWDHCNTEIATTTVEGREGQRYERELECLVDPHTDKSILRDILNDLKRIAQAQNKCAMNPAPCLVRLYRVIDYEGILCGSLHGGEAPTLSFKLKLICEFDREGNPVAPKNHERKLNKK